MMSFFPASIIMNSVLIQKHPVETNPFTPSSSRKLSLSATPAPFWGIMGNISKYSFDLLFHFISVSHSYLAFRIDLRLFHAKYVDIWRADWHLHFIFYIIKCC